MNKQDITILQDKLKVFPNDSICIIYKHDTIKCGKYSPRLVTGLKTPVYENLAEKLTKARGMRKRCMFCRKYITKYSDISWTKTFDG